MKRETTMDEAGWMNVEKCGNIFVTHRAICTQFINRSVPKYRLPSLTSKVSNDALIILLSDTRDDRALDKVV